MIKVGIVPSVDAVLRDLRWVHDQAQPRAAAQALNRVGRDVERSAVAQVASDLAVPKGAIRWHYTLDGVRGGKRRLLLIKASAKRGDQEVSIAWLPTRREPTIKLGTLRPRQTRRGVRAGKHVVEGGFVPRQPGDERLGRRRGQVYKRAGRARYPIELQAIELRSKGDRAFRSRIASSGPAFEREFAGAMRRLLDRRIR